MNETFFVFLFENDETKTWHLSSSWDELFSLTTTKKILSLKNRMMENDGKSHTKTETRTEKVIKNAKTETERDKFSAETDTLIENVTQNFSV